MISQDEYHELLNQLDPAALVAVSKMQDLVKIKTLYDYGHRAFGENRVQAMVERHETLSTDIEWHLIGQLQRNKVKQIAAFVHIIHSVDSWSLLREINKQAKKNNRVIPFLFQIKIAPEESKSGYSIENLLADLSTGELEEMKAVQCRGLMGMASFSDDDSLVLSEFQRLRAKFTELKATHFDNQEEFTELSMGMSGDYPLALQAGSTMLRIGSGIFGSRN